MYLDVFPYRDMPSSYKGKWGTITYSLRAKLTQSIWLVYKTKTEVPFLTKSEFPFASKSDMIIIGLKVWNCFSFDFRFSVSSYLSLRFIS